jgi:hypothetical protein
MATNKPGYMDTRIEIGPGCVINRRDTPTTVVFTDPTDDRVLARFRPLELYEGFKIQNFIVGMREGFKLGQKTPKEGDK